MLQSSDGVLVLRPIEEADLDFVHELRNNLVLERAAGRQPPMPRSVGEFRGYLSDPATRAAPSDGSQDSVEFLCEIDSVRAGLGGLYSIDFFARHAEIGVTLASGPWRGRGLGKLTHQLLLAYAFIDLNLRRVVASVHSDNVAVLGLCQSLGFEREGARKEYRWAKGSYVDLVLFAISREQFLAVGQP